TLTEPNVEALIKHFQPTPLDRHPVVLGRTNANKLVTLFDVRSEIVHGNFERPEDAELVLHAQRAFVGLHIASGERFARADLQLEYLLDFTGLPPIRQALDFNGDTFVTLYGDRLPHIEARWPGTALELGLNTSVSGDLWRDRRI